MTTAILNSSSGGAAGDDSSSLASTDSPRLYDFHHHHHQSNDSVHFSQGKSPKFKSKFSYSGEQPPQQTTFVGAGRQGSFFQQRQNSQQPNSTPISLARPYQQIAQHLTYSQFHQQFILGDYDDNFPGQFNLFLYLRIAREAGWVLPGSVWCPDLGFFDRGLYPWSSSGLVGDQRVVSYLMVHRPRNGRVLFCSAQIPNDFRGDLGWILEN